MTRLIIAVAVLFIGSSFSVARADHHEGKEAHAKHAKHGHKHKKSCGHKSEQHGDHQDYEHDGHHHKGHGGHVDECAGPDHAAATTPASAPAADAQKQ